METQKIQEILSWMRGTDLLEVAWKAGEEGVELRLEGAQPAQGAPFPVTALLPVASPGVGLFHFSEPGKPRVAVEGAPVTEGQVLGQLDTGAAPIPVFAPAAGRLVKILIDEGRAAEYGQPLFLIAP